MSDTVIIALCAAIPPTLTALATLVYVIKSKSENKASNDKIEAKVDAVKTEVDGKHSQLIEAIKQIATAATTPANAPRIGRKTDP